MKLHLDRDAFDVFIENIRERCSYRSDVLEKDYYVVLILEELAKLLKKPAWLECKLPEKAKNKEQER